MLWDVFCRVIDNFGDIGVCWRLAADLAARGERVRLWVDDAAALSWMAPVTNAWSSAPIQVLDWTQANDNPQPGDVVIEAFGCELPAAFVRAMAAATRHTHTSSRAPPVWINLEYLTAESYALRSHALPSPQTSGPGLDPGVGVGVSLSKWFFFPGFQNGSGGLLREVDLLARQQAFNRAAWLATLGCTPARNERVVSLFCYDNPRLPELLTALAAQPTLLLVTAGLAAEQVRRVWPPERRHSALRVHFLPLLSQTDFDHLLWACDLNFVRGEDSFTRAQWAGKPFVWQIYPQHDTAHALKLQAFTSLFDAVTNLPDLLWPVYAAWNGLTDSALALPSFAAASSSWQAASGAWREHLLTQADLTCQLLSFVRSVAVQSVAAERR